MVIEWPQLELSLCAKIITYYEPIFSVSNKSIWGKTSSKIYHRTPTAIGESRVDVKKSCVCLASEEVLTTSPYVSLVKPIQQV